VSNNSPSAGEAPVVEVQDLRVTFERKHDRLEAVRGLNLHVYSGEAVGIVGESGSGKSVSVRTLLGLAGANATVTAKKLDIFGTDARRLSERGWRAIRGGKIGLVLQDALVSLDPLRTIEQEIGETLKLHDIVPRNQIHDRVIELLTEVGMPDPELRAKQHPHELSGGLRQRALIASAIASEPALLIADEPTTALDTTVQAQVLELLDARRRAGTALLLVSHDLAVVANVCDRVVVMKDGYLVEEGPSQQVLRHPTQEYTRNLLAAIPSAESRGLTLSSADRHPLPPRRVERDSIVLRADGVSRNFKAPDGRVCHAVRDVSLEVARGESLGIVGESGSGKSTFAKILVGLLEPSGGQVQLEGQPWSPLSDKERRDRRRKIQLIAQDPLSSFDPRYSVEQVLAEPLQSQGLTRDDIAARIRQTLELVNLTHVPVAASPRTFSGGERQRLAIARALIAEPDVLVADEPVSALDVSVQAQILDLLADVQARTGAALVFISHDLGVVHHLADRVLVMKDGFDVEHGAATTVFTNPTDDYTKELLAALPKLPIPDNQDQSKP
jgi:peptide/nickel transport system ATP-binding protein